MRVWEEKGTEYESARGLLMVVMGMGGGRDQAKSGAC